MSSTAAKKLGKYTLVEKLGEEAGAEIYRGRFTPIGGGDDFVELHWFRTSEESTLSRARALAQRLERVPNALVQRVLATVDSEHGLFFVLEPVDGPSLSELLDRAQTLGGVPAAIGSALGVALAKLDAPFDMDARHVSVRRDGELIARPTFGATLTEPHSAAAALHALALACENSLRLLLETRVLATPEERATFAEILRTAQPPATLEALAKWVDAVLPRPVVPAADPFANVKSEITDVRRPSTSTQPVAVVTMPMKIAKPEVRRSGLGLGLLVGVLCGGAAGYAAPTLLARPPEVVQAPLLGYLDGAEQLADKQSYDAAGELLERAIAVHTPDVAANVRIVALQSRIGREGSKLRVQRAVALGDTAGAREALNRLAAFDPPLDELTAMRDAVEGKRPLPGSPAPVPGPTDAQPTPAVAPTPSAPPVAAPATAVVTTP